MSNDDNRFNTHSLSSSLARDPDLDHAELQAAFRGAASSIVSLLKAGQRSQTQAYKLGVSAGLRESVAFLQDDVDIPSATLDALIAYVEARQCQPVESDASEDDSPSATSSRRSYNRPPSVPSPTLPLISIPIAPSSPPTSNIRISSPPNSAFTFVAPMSTPDMSLPPTPLTRSQARRDKEHRSHHHRHSSTQSKARLPNEPESVILAADPNAVTLPVGGLKRRWAVEDVTMVPFSSDGSLDNERPLKRQNRR